MVSVSEVVRAVFRVVLIDMVVNYQPVSISCRVVARVRVRHLVVVMILFSECFYT